MIYIIATALAIFCIVDGGERKNRAIEKCLKEYSGGKHSEFGK